MRTQLELSTRGQSVSPAERDQDSYVSAPPGPPGRGRGVTDRTLRVSGDAWARASASVTGLSGRARERCAHSRMATTASTNTAIATASITGGDISPVLRI